jgi:hypothetical protein
VRGLIEVLGEEKEMSEALGIGEKTEEVLEKARDTSESPNTARSGSLQQRQATDLAIGNVWTEMSDEGEMREVLNPVGDVTLRPIQAKDITPILRERGEMSKVLGTMGMIEEVLNEAIVTDHNLHTTPGRERVQRAMPRKSASSAHRQDRTSEMLDDYVPSSRCVTMVCIVVVWEWKVDEAVRGLRR